MPTILCHAECECDRSSTGLLCAQGKQEMPGKTRDSLLSTFRDLVLLSMSRGHSLQNSTELRDRQGPLSLAALGTCDMSIVPRTY